MTRVTELVSLAGGPMAMRAASALLKMANVDATLARVKRINVFFAFLTFIISLLFKCLNCLNKHLGENCYLVVRAGLSVSMVYRAAQLSESDLIKYLI